MVFRATDAAASVVSSVWGCSADSRCALATAGEFGGEGIEVRLPEPAERIEPRVGDLEGRRVDGVEAASAVGAHGGESRLAQHAQVLRDRGLRDAELARDDLAEVAGAALAVREQLDDAPADRVSEDVERVHDTMIALSLI